MSQGLPSLDLNMDDAAPKQEESLDQLSKSFPSPTELEAKAKAQAKMSTQEISASLLEGGQTAGLDSTKRQQVEKGGSRGTSIPNSSSAFWENGQTNGGQSSLTGPRLLGAKSSHSLSSFGDLLSNSKKRVFVMIGVLVLLILGFLFMNPALISTVPGLSLLGLTSSEPGLDVEAVSATEIPSDEGLAAQTAANPNGASDPTLAATPEVDSSLEVALTWQENPYWYLPNELDPKVPSPTGKWNPEQEEAWGSAAEASLMWPKYQSLFEIRKTPLEGAEDVLWKLSTGKKFWLRIMSLMGLAEMGQKVDTAHVEQAIEGVNPELIGRFVSRFENASTAGERFILRHLVKLVNEDTRLSILRALNFQRDRFSFLYLTAGSYDPGVSVASFSKRQVQKVLPEELERLKSVVRGEVVFGQSTSESALPLSAGSTQKPTEGSVTTLSPELAAPGEASPVVLPPGEAVTGVAERQSLQEMGEGVVDLSDSSKPVQSETSEVSLEEESVPEE